MSTPEPSSLLVPTPQTARGFGTYLHSTAKTDSFVYTSGSQVIIRSLANPMQCQVFSEHRCRVFVAKFSPNGEWIASGDNRGRVLVWSIKTHHVKAEINVCRQVLDLAWSADGQRIIAVGDGNDTYARAFMWDSGNSVGDITNHSKKIISCDFKSSRPFRVVTCAEDKQVNFYSGPPFKFTSLFDQHTRFPNCVRYAPSGAYYVSVGADKKIFLFDGKSGELIKEIGEQGESMHTGNILTVAWNSESTKILTGSADCSARVWDVESGACETVFTFDNQVENQITGVLWHKQDMLALHLSGVLTYLTGEGDQSESRKIVGHQVPLSCLTVEANSAHLLTADSNGFVYKWSPSTGSITEFGNGSQGSSNIKGLAFNASGSKVFSAGFDDTLRSSDASAQLATSGLKLPGQPVKLAAGSKDDSLCVIITKNNKIIAVAGDKIASTVSLDFTPVSVAVAPDDEEVAIAGETDVILMSLSNGQLQEKSKLRKHTSKTSCVVYSPDGKFLVSADGDRYIYVWDRASSQVQNSGWRFHNAKVMDLAFSPDSSKLVSCSLDQTVLIWTDLSGFSTKRMTIDPAHQGGVHSVAFLSNTAVVSMGDDRIVRTWQLA